MKIFKIRSLYGIALFAFLAVSISWAQGGGKKPKQEPPPDPAIAYSDGWLYVMNADGTNKTVVWNRGTSYAPDWSPDARRLVFLYAPQNPKQKGIYLINLDGSGLCKLAPYTATPREWARPVWSPVPMPDGSEWIIYTDFTTRASSWSWDLYAVRANCADPGKPVNLTNGGAQDEWFWPSWSRLSNRLAVGILSPENGWRSEMAVYDVSLVNGVPRLSNRVMVRADLGLFMTGESLNPSWARNDDRILLSASAVFGQQYDLWVTDLTYSGTYALTSTTVNGGETRPCWSPNDSEIAFFDMGETESWLWKLARRVNPDGTETWVRTQVLAGPFGGNYRGHSWRRCDPCR